MDLVRFFTLSFNCAIISLFFMFLNTNLIRQICNLLQNVPLKIYKSLYPLTSAIQNWGTAVFARFQSQATRRSSDRPPWRRIGLNFGAVSSSYGGLFDHLNLFWRAVLFSLRFMNFSCIRRSKLRFFFSNLFDNLPKYSYQSGQSRLENDFPCDIWTVLKS